MIAPSNPRTLPSNTVTNSEKPQMTRDRPYDRLHKEQQLWKASQRDAADTQNLTHKCQEQGTLLLAVTFRLVTMTLTCLLLPKNSCSLVTDPQHSRAMIRSPSRCVLAVFTAFLSIRLPTGLVCMSNLHRPQRRVWTVLSSATFKLNGRTRAYNAEVRVTDQRQSGDKPSAGAHISRNLGFSQSATSMGPLVEHNNSLNRSGHCSI